MRLRSFQRAWQDAKRPRGDDEDAPSGPMHDWVLRVQRIKSEDALADVRRLFGR